MKRQQYTTTQRVEFHKVTIFVVGFNMFSNNQDIGLHTPPTIFEMSLWSIHLTSHQMEWFVDCFIVILISYHVYESYRVFLHWITCLLGHTCCYMVIYAWINAMVIVTCVIWSEWLWLNTINHCNCLNVVLHITDPVSIVLYLHRSMNVGLLSILTMSLNPDLWVMCISQNTTNKVQNNNVSMWSTKLLTRNLDRHVNNW